MFDEVMILVLILEHNLSTLDKLEDLTLDTKEVVAIHSVYHLTLTISSMNLDLIFIYLTCMGQNIREQTHW